MAEDNLAHSLSSISMPPQCLKNARHYVFNLLYPMITVSCMIMYHFYRVDIKEKL